jgi:integrase
MYRTADGKRHSVYGRTSGEATAKLQDAQARIRAGMAPVDGRLTVGGWADRWLSVYVDASDRAPRTKATYRYNIDRYIRPHLGARVLASLSPDDVQAWMNTLATNPNWSGTTRRQVLNLLRAMLRQARASGHIARNPALSDAGVATPRLSTPTITIWSPPDARYFLDALAPDDWFRPIAIVAMTCGLRNGEVCGLAWSDLDLDAGLAHIAYQTDHITQRRTTLKTKYSTATIPLPAVTIRALTAWRTRQKTLQLAAGPNWKGNDQGLVFTTDLGAPRRRRYITDALKVRIAQVNDQRQHDGLAPLQDQWFHLLRHQAGSFQYAMGARDRDVTDFLRHAPGSKVMHRYVHLDDDQHRAAADRMDRLFGDIASG